MKEIGSRKPNKYEIEILHNGMMEISFYENITPIFKPTANETEYTIEQINKMTKAELIEFAELEGIVINTGKSKAAILETVIDSLCDYSYDRYIILKEYDESLETKIRDNFDMWLSFARETERERVTKETLAYRDNLLRKVEWSLGAGVNLTAESKIAVTSFCSELQSIASNENFPYIERWPDYPVIEVISATSQSLKLNEISKACENAIHSGIDLSMGKETYHFSLKPEDQINISNATRAVENGALAYPYHSDGELYRLFSAEEIMNLRQAAMQHILYHTTYCNHLNRWIKRTENESELSKIYYGAELPEDLRENMDGILGRMANNEK